MICRTDSMFVPSISQSVTATSCRAVLFGRTGTLRYYEIHGSLSMGFTREQKREKKRGGLSYIHFFFLK